VLLLGVGEGELGTELSLLPKNRSASGEVDSAGTFRYITQYRWLDMEKYKVSWALSLKGPKRDIFVAGIFAQIRPIWIGYLGTRPKNPKKLSLRP
jgi:hypothetical protein